MIGKPHPPLPFEPAKIYAMLSIMGLSFTVWAHHMFATYAGICFWFPKMTGRMMDGPLGKLHFWTTFIGFHLGVKRLALPHSD